MNQTSANHSKNVLFITSSNLTTNPRLVKEVSVAASKGYSVYILCFQFKGWSELLDIQWIAENKKIHVRKIPALVFKNATWLLSGFIERFFQLLYPLYKKPIPLNAYASSKTSFLLKNTIFKVNKKHLNPPFQLIVAHNMGALYPAWLYHRKTKIPFIFDVEDYYPGEQINIDASNEKHRREFLLQKLLPDAACVTTASPLIGERLKALVGKGEIKNLVVINNCFPADEFEFINSRTKGQNLNRNDNEFGLGTNIFKFSNFQIDKIHFVWFSQNIAANRGLELIIPELAKIKDKVHLHLIGNLYPDFNRDWIAPNQDFITTYPPMPQKELNKFICQFDIGLALEPGKDENNLVAVSNKIWTYLQAGLYILATDTPAQVNFMKEHKKHGTIFEVDKTQNQLAANNMNLTATLKSIISDIESIRNEKLTRYTAAKEFAWEHEQGKLLKIWQQVTNKN